MAAVNWVNSAGGDFGVAANWSTDSVPFLNDDLTVSAFGQYLVTISDNNQANSLTFNAPQAALQENAGSLALTGTLLANSGFLSLNEANRIGAVRVTGGVLAFGNAGALGAGTVTMLGGELLATANETLSNALSFFPASSSTIAAAHGTTLNETASNIDIGPGATLDFGALGEDGVVIWHARFLAPPFVFLTVNVVAGTLQVADDGFNDIVEQGNAVVTVDTGATLDLGGFSLAIPLFGGGAVANSGAATTLILAGANFSGPISGPLSLVAGATDVLSGANTYTGTTTINSGGILQFGDGGATGSIGAGAISDAGTLIIDRDNAVTLNPISGGGGLQQLGTGVTSINAANTYTGGTTISAGVLAIGSSGALGTGSIALSGGELLTTANATLVNMLTFSGTSTIAAAHGTTLSENASSYVLDANVILNIGSPGQDGTILWHTNPGSFGSGTVDGVRVQAGTLRAEDESFSLIVEEGSTTIVDAGATVDFAGFNSEISDLEGAGAVTNSGAAASLEIFAANFSGTISGSLSLLLVGNTALSGLEDYTGDATLGGLGAPVTLANTGTYDLTANSNIDGAPTSVFLNNGLFEKTGLNGVSDVTTNFINGGTLNVLSGRIKFSGGFINTGVIHGLVTRSGGVTTISAPVSSDFSGDALSDILWQNTSGQASVWEVNGNSLIGGGPVSPNPGPSWTEIGTGDFNGDGHSDILFQNASSGQTSIWEMNGNSLIGGGPVSPNPGPNWKAIGTGDFNDAGLSDILFQNTSSGQVSIWEMNENKPIGDGPVSPNPGLSWKVVGTGDFNDDGHSDVLFQNASTGQVSIWEMNGTTLIGGGTVGANLGPGWRAIGTGDFNDDGHSDILFQNTTSGQVSIWEMNGNNVSGGGTVSTDPGSSWRAIGTGDLNGDGHSDILFQNTSGQASIWEMNGNTLIGVGAVSPNPGSSWRAVA
jgi:autotransporter-associated beta strand protein